MDQIERLSFKNVTQVIGVYCRNLLL